MTFLCGVTSNVPLAVNEGRQVGGDLLFCQHGGHYMPSKSAKQARMFAAAAHDPKFAKKVGIPQGVAKEFNEADKGTSIRKDIKSAMKGKR